MHTHNRNLLHEPTQSRKGLQLTTNKRKRCKHKSKVEGRPKERNGMKETGRRRTRREGRHTMFPLHPPSHLLEFSVFFVTQAHLQMLEKRERRVCRVTQRSHFILFLISNAIKQRERERTESKEQRSIKHRKMPGTKLEARGGGQRR